MASPDVFMAVSRLDIAVIQYAVNATIVETEDQLKKYSPDSVEYAKCISLLVALEEVERQFISGATLHGVTLIEHALDLWNAFPDHAPRGGTSPTR